MRYVVYKQPLSLDRFFIHDVTIPESASCRLEAAFVLVSLNRFQQVVTIHTFQAPSDQSKVCPKPVAYPGILFGGGSTNSVEDRENGDLGAVDPLVRGSGGSCNLVQEISFHIVEFS
jgi:hypothetical protein